MTTPGSVEHALLLAKRGWSVFPVHFKTPLTPDGFLDAKKDEEGVKELWRIHSAKMIYGKWTEANGVGVATGEASNVWVLDIDVSDEKRGDESLAELEGTQGILPSTYQVMTGGGGIHFYFSHVEGIRNSRGKIAEGIDVRGDGGYVVGPGSTHDSGGMYRREIDSNDSPVDAPTWLIQAAVEVSSRGDAEPVPGPVEGDIRPWLQEQGWTRVQVLRSGDEYWRRPGKNRGEHSGVWHPPTDSYPAGYFYNLSSNSPGMEAETLYGTKIELFVEEGKWLDEMKSFLETERESEEIPDSELKWHPVSLYDVWDESPEDPPSIGVRSDGVCLLYQKKVHTIYGEPGGMKSWFCQVIASQVVEEAGTVLFVDLENSRKSLCDRFKYLGLSQDDLKSIDVINPDTIYSAAERQLVEKYCAERAYRLIVLDGTTDAMALFGLNPNDSIDFARFDKGLLKPLAATGAAVIYVDHVVKNKDDRGGWGTGSQHKKAAIDGAAFGVDPVSSFGKGMTGKARIILHKDKNGDLPQHAIDGDHSTIAELEMCSDPDTHAIKATLASPSPDLNPDFRPTIIMGKVAAYIERNSGLSKDVIIKMSGVDSGKKEWVRLAFQLLEAEGFIAGDLGDPRDRRYRSVKPYSEMQDYLDHSREPKPMTPADEVSMAKLRKITAVLEEPTGFPEDFKVSPDDLL